MIGFAYSYSEDIPILIWLDSILALTLLLFFVWLFVCWHVSCASFCSFIRLLCFFRFVSIFLRRENCYKLGLWRSDRDDWRDRDVCLWRVRASTYNAWLCMMMVTAVTLRHLLEWMIACMRNYAIVHLNIRSIHITHSIVSDLPTVASTHTHNAQRTVHRKAVIINCLWRGARWLEKCFCVCACSPYLAFSSSHLPLLVNKTCKIISPVSFCACLFVWHFMNTHIAIAMVGLGKYELYANYNNDCQNHENWRCCYFKFSDIIKYVVAYD